MRDRVPFITDRIDGRRSGTSPGQPHDDAARAPLPRVHSGSHGWFGAASMGVARRARCRSSRLLRAERRHLRLVALGLGWSGVIETGRALAGDEHFDRPFDVMRERTDEKFARRCFDHSEPARRTTALQERAPSERFTPRTLSRRGPCRTDFVAGDGRLGRLSQRRLQAHDRNAEVGLNRFGLAPPESRCS